MSRNEEFDQVQLSREVLDRLLQMSPQQTYEILDVDHQRSYFIVTRETMLALLQRLGMYDGGQDAQ